VIYEYHEPVTYLKAVFLQKTKENPRFSLRAFAVRLGLSPGALHKILNDKKKLSVERAHDIGKRLGLKDAELEYFTLLVQKSKSKNLEIKSILEDRISEVNPRSTADEGRSLTIEHFKLLSDWSGLAILQLIGQVQPPRPEKFWTKTSIKKSLRLSTIEIQDMIDRLKRLELIEEDEEGNLTRIIDSVLLTSEIPNASFQNYYQSLMKKVEASITDQTPDEKVIGAEVFAFDPKQFPELKKITHQYLSRLSRLSEKSVKKTEMYQAFCNVFRLTERNSVTSVKSKSRGVNKK
jgi:uncharacterized protein (TIGR02147 family)